MITGAHAIVFSPAAEQVRAFFADVLGLPGGRRRRRAGRPPCLLAELAVHPAGGDLVATSST